MDIFTNKIEAEQNLQMPYSIGLDVGVASVGWAITRLQQDQPCGIVDMGVRMFNIPEDPKTGESLAVARRQARSARRRTSRRKIRKERIREFIVSSGLLTESELEHLYEVPGENIYAIRVKALDEALSPAEFARVLIHLSQRRGFRSNRKGSAGSGDNGALLQAVSGNKTRMAEKGYRTVAEMFLKDPIYSEHIRNKASDYLSTVSRDMVADEARAIFAAQRLFAAEPIASAVTIDKEDEYLSILLSQRSFDEGPGGNSKYSGDIIEEKIGPCTFEKGEKRASRHSYSFELFRLLQNLNHFRIEKDKKDIGLTDEQKNRLFALAYESEDLTYGRIRKELAISDDWRFKGLPYADYTDEAITLAKEQKTKDGKKRNTKGGKKKPTEHKLKAKKNESQEEKLLRERDEAEFATKFQTPVGYHTIRKALDKIEKGYIERLSHDQLDAIAETLMRYKTDEKIHPMLRKVGLEDTVIDALSSVNFNGTGSLSIKACKTIIPYLREGLDYDKACEKAGYAFRGHNGIEKKKFLPALGKDAFNEITSPVTIRSISQTIKVVNAIIREQGHQPTYINIETARELGKSPEERKEIAKKQTENRKVNEAAIVALKEIFPDMKGEPSGQDIIKYKLWKEQGEVCAYSLERIERSRLLEDGYVQVDHIVPFSVSFDDRYSNKVLVKTSENQKKRDRVPLEYLTGEKRDRFIVWVNNTIKDSGKRNRLLKECITEDDLRRAAGFRESDLKQTQHIAAFLRSYIDDHLEFEPYTGNRRKHVTAVNGAVTAFVRKRWGINKVRANGDIHHAVDALVIACTTDATAQLVTRYFQAKEKTPLERIDYETGEIISRFPYPWAQFKNDLREHLSPSTPWVHPIFVSRMANRKITGAAHKETIKSLRMAKTEDGKEKPIAVFKKPIEELTLNSDGEIAGYYNPDSDRLLYKALKSWIKEHKRLTALLAEAKVKKDKEETERIQKLLDKHLEFHKPKKDGTPGPLVRSVKLQENATSYVPVHGGKGIADQNSMIRIDVFHIEGEGYYFVPIYVADTIKKDLPNVAATRATEPVVMDDRNFVFSLYPGDLIRVKTKTTIKKAGIALKKTCDDADLEPEICRDDVMLYYVSANRSKGTIDGKTHDGAYKVESMGVKTLLSLEKYTVDVLGRYHRVNREVRKGFAGIKRS